MAQVWENAYIYLPNFRTIHLKLPRIFGRNLRLNLKDISPAVGDKYLRKALSPKGPFWHLLTSKGEKFSPTLPPSNFVLLFELSVRGIEWFFEKRGSQKILAWSRNLGSVCDRSRSLVFGWFCVSTVFNFFMSWS